MASAINLLMISNEARRIVDLAACRMQEQEACGFLFGHIQGGVARAETAQETRNILASPTRFAISGDEYRLAVEAGRQGLKLVAIYHTHCGSAKPSRRDVESLLELSDLWLIAGAIKSAPIPNFSDWRCFASVKNRIKRVDIAFI
jgi:proteasome lid subunit RPN8/RPN11